uniref:CSON001294 protein n=1 Tax=Culicoides sonorensis TaxID=179676 RepID=A0A336KY36_CULSO
MGENKPALYAAGVTCLAFVCFALSATAVGLPVWGYFSSSGSSWDINKGYFGPWRTCKSLNYGRENCRSESLGFKTPDAVYFTGIFGVISCICLGLFCIFSVLQIAMISAKDKVVIKYSVLVVFKLVLVILAVILSLVATLIFAIVTDDIRGGYRVTNGISFYLELLVIAFSIGLFVLAMYDVMMSRRTGGDPTMPTDPNAPAITFNNPGFREGGRNGGISMTDSSAKPYSSINGSIQSMNTTVTSVTNGSSIGSVTRSPLRSSLKKPRPRNNDGLGIQNPGFSGSGTSPTMQRSGSVKKVRIQTQSTDV